MTKFTITRTIVAAFVSVTISFPAMASTATASVAQKAVQTYQNAARTTGASSAMAANIATQLNYSLSKNSGHSVVTQITAALSDLQKNGSEDVVAGLSKAERVEILGSMIEAIALTGNKDTELMEILSGDILRAVNAIKGDSSIENSSVAIANAQKMIETYVSQRKAGKSIEESKKIAAKTINTTVAAVHSGCRDSATGKGAKVRK